MLSYIPQHYITVPCLKDVFLCGNKYTFIYLFIILYEKIDSSYFKYEQCKWYINATTIQTHYKVNDQKARSKCCTSVHGSQ